MPKTVPKYDANDPAISPAMRYFYAMGREGILPRSLGRTHPVHKSPHVASFTQTGVAVLIVLL